MNFRPLEQHIMDVMQEQQIKLGYLSETVHLYYPLASLNQFLGGDYITEQMTQLLHEFSQYTASRLGTIEISSQNDRFCLTIPPQGADYVHQNMGDCSFLKDFIHTISEHGCTMEDLLAQFHRYSSNVQVRKMVDTEDFDYLIYFEDGIPNSYRYCIKQEGCHMIYHRFTPEDFRAFGFNVQI